MGKKTSKRKKTYLCNIHNPKTFFTMKVGIPKEIKNNENRVGMTPAGVQEFVKHHHDVYVQHTAGEGSGFSDEAYKQAGAKILPAIEDIYATADMIVKVKEPIEAEYGLIRKDQVVFTYFHLACDEPLTRAMINSQAVCIAYETVEKSDRSLPLLIPMSEVAGRMAAQNGAYYLQKTKGGKGKLIGGVPGVKPARVLVLGGGTVGEAAAITAAGMGAEVTITDISLPRLRQLAMEMPKNVRTLYSSRHNIEQELPTTDIVIGSVLIPGDAAPKLITRDMLPLMEKGTVMVDVAIDQGGCFETSHATTHSEPTYEVDGIVHYAVANIPGAVPHTSTIALTNATLRYALALADKGWKQACKDDEALRKGVNVANGEITFEPVAKVWGLPYKALDL